MTILLVAAIVLLAGTCSAMAVSLETLGSTAAQITNAEREVNGIPGSVNYLPLETGCVNDEKGVSGGHWWAYGNTSKVNPFEANPYADAPLHFMSFLDPSYVSFGMDIGECMVQNFGRGGTSPTAAEAKMLVYPASGTTGVPNSLGGLGEALSCGRASDPCTTVTWKDYGADSDVAVGTPIYVVTDLWDGWHLTNVKLEGPGGSVPVAVVDRCSAANPLLRGYVHGGAIAIPKSPLAAATKYSFSGDVINQCGEGPVSRHVESNFQTITPTIPTNVRLRPKPYQSVRSKAYTVLVDASLLDAPAPGTGTHDNYELRLAVSGAGKTVKKKLWPLQCSRCGRTGRYAASFSHSVPISRPGKYTLCATGGGVGTSLVETETCTPLELDWSPVRLMVKIAARQSFSSAKRSGIKVRFRCRRACRSSIRVDRGFADVGGKRASAPAQRWKTVRVRLNGAELRGPGTRLKVRVRSFGERTTRWVTLSG